MTQTPQHPDHSGEAIAILKVDPILKTGVVVESTGQRSDGRLEDRHSAYHDNISPPLRWTAVPDSKAWAVIVEDPDAPQAQPFVHWMIWNIPGAATSIPATEVFYVSTQDGLVVIIDAWYTTGTTNPKDSNLAAVVADLAFSDAAAPDA